MTKTTFVTTSIPYVNASPHIGHALELVQADAIARYRRLRGDRVILQTGTDENAHKNVVAAREAGLPVEELVRRNAMRFRELASVLDIGVDSFIRTTEERHRRGVERLWSMLDGGDLSTRAYQGLYCQGCEDFLGAEDLVDGKCPDHLAEPELVSETNTFFRLSRYQEEIRKLLESGALRIVPEARRAEVLSFVRSGLRDISVSRDAGRMSGWGIGVPGDPSQIIYVWIDALMNYVTGLTSADSAWDAVWNAATRKTHVIGKNVWKFHAVYWPALLLSARLPLPDEIVVHGFLTVDGRKISKSLGNAIDPFSAAARRGADSLRHYLLSLPPFLDSDYSEAAHDRTHESRLANGLGNLVSRLTALCAMAGIPRVPIPAETEAPAGYHESMAAFRLDRAMDALWGEIGGINAGIDGERPWATAGTAATADSILGWCRRLHGIVRWLEPFLPRTSTRIAEILATAPVRKCEALFPREGTRPEGSPSPT